MASDVEDLTKFYANLPSIFEIDSLSATKSSSDKVTTFIDNEMLYKPIFGSFLFANSEPFTRAAFAESTLLPSIDMELKQTQHTNDDHRKSVLTDQNISNSNNDMKSRSHLSLTSTDNTSDMDDEDDFDGIPIRHDSTRIFKSYDNKMHLVQNHHNTYDLSDILNQYMTQNHDVDHDSDSYLNDFMDDEQQQNEEQRSLVIEPSLLKDIPDIDDPNEHDQQDDDDDNNRMPSDQIDMFDQSDISIRSSSPDSLLSSSHLRDDYDDDDDVEEINKNNDVDDVTQWNDDFILGKLISQNDRPGAPLPPAYIFNVHSFDRVNFIDSSPTHSRSSNNSSNLSLGYNDHMQILINDDDLVISSDSDSFDDGDDKIYFENKISADDNNLEEPTLEVNLDYNGSRSSSSSYHQSLTNSTRSLSPTADQSPILAIDDDLPGMKPSSSPIDTDGFDRITTNRVVSAKMSLEDLFELKNTIRRNEIVRDIVRIRHIFNDNDNDDEFIAVLHNPTVFEDMLNNNDYDQQSDLLKQTNTRIATLHASSQSCIDNEIESNSLEHYQNIQQSSSLSVLNTEESGRPNIKSTNHPSVTTVNHLLIRKEEHLDENINAINSPSLTQKKEQKLEERIRSNIDISHKKEKRDLLQVMSSDDELDNDQELLNTLAQLHGLAYLPRPNTKDTDQQHDNRKIYAIHNLVIRNDENDHRKVNNETGQAKPPSACFSSTSLTSSGLLNDEDLNGIDFMLDSDASSSLIISTDELNTSIVSSNQLTTNDIQQTQTNLLNTSNDNNHLPQTSKSHEITNQNGLVGYLDWLTSHLNDSVQSSTIDNESQSPKTIPNEEKQQLNNNNKSSSIDRDVLHVINQLVSNSLALAFGEICQTEKQTEYFVEQVLLQAVYEVHNENSAQISDHSTTTMNCQTSTHEQILDPFDNLWIKHFEASDDIIDQNNMTPISFYSNTYDETSSYSNQDTRVNGSMTSSLSLNPFDSTIPIHYLTKSSFIDSKEAMTISNALRFDDDFIPSQNDSSVFSNGRAHYESKNLSPTAHQDDDARETTATAAPPQRNSVELDSDDEYDSDSDHGGGNANVEATTNSDAFGAKTTPSQLEIFVNNSPLKTYGIESIVEQIDSQLSDSAPAQRSSMMVEKDFRATNSYDGDDEPWELDEYGEDAPNTVQSAATQRYDSNVKAPSNTTIPSSARTLATTVEESEEVNGDENEQENYDNYFHQQKSSKDADVPVTKSVRFDDNNMEQVSVLTPKDSLDESASSEASSVTASTEDDDDDDETVPNLSSSISDRITDFMNSEKMSENKAEETTTTTTTKTTITPPPETEIVLTESEDLPPPLPPLPPLVGKKKSTEKTPSKSSASSSPASSTDSKRKIPVPVEQNIASINAPTTSMKQPNNTDTKTVQSSDSAILRLTTIEDNNTDPDEKDGLIPCIIDGNQISIDAKSISPFKCILSAVGNSASGNEAAVIVIYGCWLPDRRLREYHYIMDHLFYYVYHKLEQLVTNDYILIYFHGATPKHRTPELKFFRKYYQMINFRLRKTLRAVYVVHPTRWLRTIIALSRPFFSNKFYHKIHYLFTTAQLAREFPQNPVSIPAIVEQTDWLYSQKYDRPNSGLKTLIDRSSSQPITTKESESAA